MGAALTDGTLTVVAGPDGLSLWTYGSDPTGRDLSTVSEFTVTEGQHRVPRSRRGTRRPRLPPRPVDAVYAIARH